MNTHHRQRAEIIFYAGLALLLGVSFGYYLGMAQAAAKVAEFASK